MSCFDPGAAGEREADETTPPGAGQRLEEACARLHQWRPEFGGEGGENGLTNHGPMAVEVLAQRGLHDQVEPWLNRYVARLEELPRESDRITEANWAAATGKRARVGDWAAYFERAGSEAPWHQVLAHWWPRQLPAIASALRMA